MGTYKKYVYWLEDTQFARLKAIAVEEGISKYEANKAICVPLSKRLEMGFVLQDAWDKYPL